MAHFETEQFLPGLGPEEVFLFFADPRNLPRIAPPWARARVVDLRLVPPAEAAGRKPLAGVGSEIAISLRILPFLPLRMTWVARITEFEYGRGFADVHTKGPFPAWHHRHRFEAAERNGRAGTLVRDVIEYELGLGPVGRLAAWLFVQPQLRGVFAYRHRLLEGLLLEP